MNLAYKRCIVPDCGHTTINKPEKLYFRVPDNPHLRNEWLRLAGRNVTEESNKSTMYFCEDHFNPPDDMENHIQYQIMGSVKRIRLRPNCLPTKFKYQTEVVVPLATDSTDFETIPLESNVPVPVAEIINTSMPTSAISMDTVSGRDKLIQAYPDTSDKSTQANPEHRSKPTQVLMKSKYRSKNIQTEWETMDRASSPTKLHYATTGTMPITENDYKKPSTSGCTIQNQTLFQEYSETSSVTTSLSEVSSLSLQDISSDSSDSSEINSKASSMKYNQECLQNTLVKIKNNPRYYIGVSRECYYVIEILQNCTNISEDHILLCLVKIRLNHTFTEIGNNFGISKSYASKIFRKNVPLIAKYLKPFIFKSKMVQSNLPMAFRHKYHHISHIIDAFEIEIQKPMKAVHQALSWSDYKKANTLKYLISSTPDGVIDYISAGYSGRITDVALVENCNYLMFLEPGEYILADRGFKHIEQLLLQKNVHLVRPPSVAFKSKLTKSDARKTKQIASLRIHIERVIRRLREYSLLKPHSVINSRLIGLIDECVIIACALINTQDALIKSC